MFFKQFAAAQASLSYFFGCASQGVAVAVDVVAGDELEIFPGHQAGSACGASLSGKPSSTIGFEKRWNGRLALGREDFIESITAEMPPPPSDMARTLELNRRA